MSYYYNITKKQVELKVWLTCILKQLLLQYDKRKNSCKTLKQCSFNWGATSLERLDYNEKKEIITLRPK